MTGRSLPTINNVTSILNGDRNISTNSKQYYFKLNLTGRSSPTVNNVTSKINGDRKISTNSKQCHFKTKR
jgi:hypothetical protein